MASAVQPAHKDAARLRARLAKSRAITDALFPVICPEALYDRPIPERHRLIFYLGHLEAFDWNLIGGACGVKPFHAAFDKLFAFGIDPVDGGLPTDQPQDWPSEREIRDYNAQVRARLDQLIPQAEDILVHVAIEHRLMHAETLAYLMHQLPLDKKIEAAQATFENIPPKPAKTARIPGGTATLGQRRGAAFGWDNEFETVSARVP